MPAGPPPMMATFLPLSGAELSKVNFC